MKGTKFMYTMYGMTQCPLYNNPQMYGTEHMYNACNTYPCNVNMPMHSPAYDPLNNQMMSQVPPQMMSQMPSQVMPQMIQHMMPQIIPQHLPYQYDPYEGKAKGKGYTELKDYGPDPFTVNIEEATTQNEYFRTALWTGKHLQLTLMSIGVGEDIGLEVHPELDQFIRLEQGQGIVKMGNSSDRLDYQQSVSDDYAFIIPAGKWHNLINTGDTPIKLYSIYAPPQHPHGTIHKTKAEAMAAEEHHHH